MIFRGLNLNVLQVCISDHFPVCAIFSALTATSSPTEVRMRPITNRGRETFTISLANISIESDDDVNYLYGNYHNKIFHMYNISFPLRVSSLKSKNPAPWMSPRLKQCIRKKAKLYKMYLKGNISRGNYTMFKNRLTNAIRRSKALYYSKLFYENAKNQKLVWSIINGILNKRKNPVLKQIAYNGLVLTGGVMADFVNNYFVSIATTLTGTLQEVSEFVCLSPPVMVSCFFYPASLSEVFNVISRLKNRGNKILDISPALLKENIILFVKHFKILYNLSLDKITFPDILKIARISPAYKSGQTELVDNYRPISSLPVFSKIFERLTLNRMENFISRLNILTPCQFGFRKGKNTSLAVIRLVTHVVQAFHKKIYSACFFLDLKKAFDTVNHDLLIKKLEHYGFRGQCSDYLYSYFNNRKQYVQVDGHDSSYKPVVSGVPQGSILGPLCFSIFINDMPLAVKEETILFADDAAFVIVSPTLIGLYDKIKALFNDLTRYLNMNKLIPNSRKSKLMMFRSRPILELPSFVFGGEEIQWVSEYKYLGITIMDNLSYSKHINNTALTISRITGTFSCLRQIVPRDILIKLYYALVYPHLTNHITVWGSAPPSHLRILVIRINNILRTILGVAWENNRPVLSNDDLYRELNVLRLNNIFRLNLYKLLRLLLDGELPEFWQLLLANYVSQHGYNTRGVRFRHPNIACEVERRALSYQLILMLENLPLDILETGYNASLKHFKRALLDGQ